jgi:putative peptidoglycan lipid II flippase
MTGGLMLRKFFTNSAGILLSRIAGLVRTTLLAAVLGQSIYSDMFLVAFKLPNVFRRIFGEGAFVQAFMPSFVASRNKGVFAVTIFRRFLLYIVATSLVVSLFPSLFTRLLAVGFSSKEIAQTAPLTAITFWYLALIFIVTFLASLLQYREHYATTAFGTVLLNLSMITALLIWRKDDPSVVVYALAISVVVGGILQVILHLWSISRLKLDKLLAGGWKYRHSRNIEDEQKRFNKLFLPAVWGSSTPQINAFLDTWLASFLVAGSISALTYANLVFTLPLALISIAASTALFPSITKDLNNNRTEQAYRNLAKAFWMMLFALGIAALGGAIFARPIIWLLFEHGRFTQHDTIITANVLTMYMIGLIPFGLSKLLSLYLYASHRQAKAAKIASLSLLANIIASLSLIKPLGVIGLALSGSIGGWVLFLLTLREIGWDRMKNILVNKKMILFVSSMLALGILFYFVNIWITGLIR